MNGDDAQRETRKQQQPENARNLFQERRDATPP